MAKYQNLEAWKISMQLVKEVYLGKDFSGIH